MADPVVPEAPPQVQAAPQQEPQLSPRAAEEATRAQIAERVMARVQPEAGGDGTGSPATAPPQGAPGDGAGGETPGDGSQPGAGGTDAAEIPTDPAKFREYLAAREEELEQRARERLDNQKRSLLGSVQAEQRRARNSQLLTELEELSDESLRDRIKDPEVAAALAEVAASESAVVEEQARQYVMSKTMPQMFAAGARIVEAGGADLIATFNDQAKIAEINAREDGVWGFVVDEAIAAGGKQAVEKFKKSAEYAKAIQDAKDQAVHDALGGIGAQPARDSRAAPGGTAVPQGATAQERAVMRARERFGADAPTVDLEELAQLQGGRRRTAVRN